MLIFLSEDGTYFMQMCLNKPLYFDKNICSKNIYYQISHESIVGKSVLIDKQQRKCSEILCSRLNFSNVVGKNCIFFLNCDTYKHIYNRRQIT